MARILSIKVSGVETLQLSNGRLCTTAIRKKAIPHAIVHTLGIVGNDVADKKHHGGVDKALFFMAEKSLQKLSLLLQLNYNYLQESYFGENFVISEWDEWTVCIGDQFRIGEVLVEVCQPRKPCNTLSLSTEVAETRKTVIDTGLVGWYTRVLQGGKIQPNDKLELCSRPNANLTVAAVHNLLAKPARDLDKTLLNTALACEQLAEGYKKTLAKQAIKCASYSQESAFFNTPEF